MVHSTQPSRIDDAINVLRLTNDGNDLAASDLSLVEAAVNGRLTDDGIMAFDALREQCENQTYRKPWLFGIEHLTIDQAGYVHWKDQEAAIEHFTFYDEASVNRLRKHAVALAETCRLLETQGIAVPTFSDVINHQLYSAN